MSSEQAPTRKKAVSPRLSELDWSILEELRHDPHATPRVLAERLKRELSEVAASVRSLDRRRVSHVLAVLDLKVAGQSFGAVQLEVSGRPLDEVAAELSAIPHAMLVSATSGGAGDLLVFLRFIDLAHLHQLLYGQISNIRGIVGLSVNIVLDVPLFKSQYVSYGGGATSHSIEENMADLATNYSNDLMDELDRCIVAELQQNARRSINSISRKYNINASTIRYRIRNLESRGLMRFITYLTPGEVGLETVSLVEFEVCVSKIPSIIAQMSEKPWLSQLFVCSGSVNITSIILTDSPETMVRIKSEELSNIDGVRQVRISSLVKTYLMDLRWGQRYVGPDLSMS